MKSNKKYCVANVHMNSLGEVSVSYRAYMKGPYGAHFVGDIDDEYVLWYDTEEEARGMIYNREGECILSRLTEYIPKFQDKEANCTDHKEEEKSMAATKDQELKALSQIKKIVEELGEGSYVGMAFEGCFEIAEDNIGNDFGNSMKMRAETAERKLEEITRAQKECVKDMEAEREKSKRLEKNFSDYQQKMDALQNAKKQAEEQITDLTAKVISERERVVSSEMEIVRLKAKLYDYISKDQEVAK